jgi:phage gp37-like protein
VLAELETNLVALIKNSALGKRLRWVDSLPDLEGDSLIGRFANDAPAVYVAMGSFPIKGGMVQPKYGIACIARNSRSHQAARHGDGVQIGLHEMLEAVMVLVDGQAVAYSAEDAIAFEAYSCDLISSEDLYKRGVYAGVVQIQATADVPLPAALDDLADFKTFHADFDIDPHQAPAEHNKWLDEPPDHSSSTPELSDTLPLQE